MNLNPFKKTPWHKKQQNTLVNVAALLIVLDQVVPLLFAVVDGLGMGVTTVLKTLKTKVPAAKTVEGKYSEAT